MSSKYAYQLEKINIRIEKEDFGEIIRKHIKDFANPANLNQKATDKITQQIDSLERLSNNTYGRKYQRVFTSTATGLTAQQCSQALTTEFLEYLNSR